MASDVDGASAKPATRRLRLLVAALVAAEGLLLVGAAVVFVVSSTTQLGLALGLAGFALALGVGLGACAYGLSRGLGWSRAPVATWQLVQIGVAMPSLRSEWWYLGIPMLAVSLLVLGLVLTNRVIAAPDPH